MAESWDAFLSLLQQPSSCDFSLDANAIPGITAAQRADLESLRQALSIFFSLCSFISTHADAVTAESFNQLAEDARSILLTHEVAASRQPFQPVVAKSNVADLAAALKSENGATACSVNWGPPASANCIRNLLCPVGLFLLAWIGDEFAAPMLALAYAFTQSHESFNIAFLKSPIDTKKLQLLSLKQKVAAVRAIPTVTSPGGAVCHLAKLAQAAMVSVAQAVYHAAREHGLSHAAFTTSVISVHISEAVKAPATQYLDCTSADDRQVNSPLPDKPSLPEYMPNFVDDTHSAWFRNAQYMYDNIRMPAAAALRGDPLAELTWHRYVSDVLHARLKSMNLSEHQVIQHLSQKVLREHQHFVCAQETAADPHCTVRKWLDTIRDFYFTSGAFRQKLEHAWTRYQSTNAADFNDLIHHIKTYYQMIFLDYAHLTGKLHQLDFAWILFSKIQALLQQTCTSTVANTLRMFLPLSNLVNKMQHVLTPAQHLSRYEADEAAKSFVSWIVQQLQQVREAANTAQRYTNVDTSINVDFARLGKPSHHVFNTMVPQAAAAVAHSRPPVRRYDNSKRLGMQNSGPSRAGVPPSPQPRSFRIQGLKEAVNSTGPTADESIIQWTKDVLLNQPEHLVPTEMK